MLLIIIGIIGLFFAFPLIVQLIAAIYFLASMLYSCIILPIAGIIAGIFMAMGALINSTLPYLSAMLTPGIIVFAVVFVVGVAIGLIKKLFSRWQRSRQKK